ncbi:MAG: NAD(P)/FAD-dependent oxidoreductase [Pseudomonadota bacterium]
MSESKSRLASVWDYLSQGLFHSFLALYLYLDTGLGLNYAILASVVPLVLYLLLRKRLPTLHGTSRLFAIFTAAVAGFLALNPFVVLGQIGLMLFCATCVLVFRVLFRIVSQSNQRWIGLSLTTAAAYVLFIAFPHGPMRLTPETPTVSADKPLDVAVVGAGFSGIGMGVKLLDAGYTNFQIYESSEEIGGTWWNNQYPGLSVDVASDVYSFSFNPNPYWSRTRSPRSELHAYAKQTAEDFGITPFIQTSTAVKQIKFNDESQLWNVSLENGDSVSAMHVFFSTGGQYLPKIPNFAGLSDYRGDLFHSARWDHDVDLKGKRIAVVGSAASAIQIIPELAKVAAQVDMYQRTASWIMTAPNNPNSAFKQWANRYVPLYQKTSRLRQSLMTYLAVRFILPKDSTRRAELQNSLLTNMREIIEDPELEQKLVPDYPWGCKRPLVTADFYQTLNKPTVDVIVEGIDSLTEQGIRSSSGTERDYDIIVMATGYKVAESNVTVIGPGGKDIDQILGDPPTTYRSVMAGMPNFHLGTGLNRGLFGSFLLPIEVGFNYSIQLIRAAGDDTLVSVLPEAQQEFNDALQADLQKTVWAEDCKSWYKTEGGHIIANYPYTGAKMIKDSRIPDYSKFVFEPRVDAEQANL